MFSFHQLDSSSSPLKYVTTCYSPRPGLYGWCGTVTDIQDAGTEDQVFSKIQPDQGWGFCQRECSEDEHHKKELSKDQDDIGIGN